MDERIETLDGGKADVVLPYYYTITMEVLDNTRSRLDYQEFFPVDYAPLVTKFVEETLAPMLAFMEIGGVTICEGTGEIIGNEHGPGIRLHLEGPTAQLFDFIASEALMRARFGRLTIADFIARTAVLTLTREGGLHDGK